MKIPAVKDLLKADLPPTNADAKLRFKHASGSVIHNTRHFTDHATDIQESLKKVYTVDSAAARKQTKNVIKKVGKNYYDLKKLLKALK